MPISLVFVHGVRSHARSEDGILADWTAALANGMSEAGHPGIASDLLRGNVEVRLAYYADLFGTSTASPRGVADLPGDDEAQELKPALAEMIEDLGRKPETSGDGRLDAATAQLDPGGQPQGTGQVARRFLNAATTLCDTRLLRGFGQWSGARAMIWDLRQVNRYLCRQEPDETGATLDQRIRGRLTAVMDDGPTIVVAHSLGTIVAYEALHENRCQTPLLVTLGSPLGMRTIVTPRLLPQPPRAPESVGEWRNFWDKDDPIAVRPRLENAVGRNSAGAIPCSRRVDSDSAWVHPATKYLEHPGVGGPIAHVLESYLG